MKIKMTKPETFPLVNGHSVNEFSNRLTVFDDGDVRIEELHSSNSGSISALEFEGRAISCHLPDVVFDIDVESIVAWLESRSFDEVKDFLASQPIESAVDFFSDYIHGGYEDCASDAEMAELVNSHGRDVDAICDAIRAGGETYVSIEDWVETWLDNSQAD